MSRHGVTEEDVEREAEQDDRNYETAREDCLWGSFGGFSVAPALAFLLFLPAWLLVG